MKADSIHLFDFLENSRTIFEIPVFQRNYEWGKPQCAQLFKDLTIAANNHQDHFIGAVVYVSETGDKLSHIYRIIDGQQRMMSLMLLLKALADTDEEDREEIEEQYLTNKYLNDNNHLKLKPVAHDIAAFEAVMDNAIEQYGMPSKVVENYQFFLKSIKESSLTSKDLYEAMNHFNMVYIELTNDVEDENPQVIFESLNSTGVSLSASDLVRNFLLMKLDSNTQEQLYNKYWVKMEQIFVTNTFAEFIRSYLIMRTHKLVNKDKIYSIYKEFCYDSGLNAEEALSDLYRFAIFDNQLLHADTKIAALNRVLRHINMMDSKVVYPYFLMLLDMSENYEISEAELVEIANTMDSYLFRIKACKLPTNGLNRLIISLCDRAKAKGNYHKRLFYTLNATFPDDKTVHDSLMHVNLYKQRNNVAKLALIVLEEAKSSKETINFDDVQVEHIMPQRLNNEWRLNLPNADKINEELGGVIGNLTLTKFNQELSNKIYSEKKEWYKDSNIKITREIEEQFGIWNRETIIRRTRMLVKDLIALFPKPTIKVEVKEIAGEHSITESIDVTGKKPTFITINGEDFGIDSWRKMLITFMEYIWRIDSRNYDKIRSDRSLDKMLFISARVPVKLNNGYNIETNFSASVILAIVSKISEICDIADQVTYTVK